MVPIAELVPYANNARTHSPAQIATIAASIREFGWTNPVLTDGAGGIIAGHGRVMAAAKLRMAEVPVIELAHLSPGQKRAYILADNRIALASGWDDELLKIELGALKAGGFDMSLTGFDMGDLDRLLGGGGLDHDPDDVPEAPAAPVTRLGDIWNLGSHRLYADDCALILQSLPGKIAAVITDPPYGIGKLMKGGQNTGHWNKLAGGNKWDIMAPDMEPIRSLAPQVIIWGGNYFPLPVSRCWLAWIKTNSVPTQADMELAWTNIDAPSRCIEAPTGGSYVREHPTQKPVSLISWCVEFLPKKNGLILDPYAGSGTTIIAAEIMGRTCVAIEIDPRYVDVAVLRWQAFTGKTATLSGDRRTFAEIAEERRVTQLADM